MRCCWSAAGIMATFTFWVLTRRDLGRAVIPVTILHEGGFGVEAAAGEYVRVPHIRQTICIYLTVGIKDGGPTVGLESVSLNHRLGAVRETVDSEQRVRVVIDYLIRVAEVAVGEQCPQPGSSGACRCG